MSQTSVVKQISENPLSVPNSPEKRTTKAMGGCAVTRYWRALAV